MSCGYVGKMNGDDVPYHVGGDVVFHFGRDVLGHNGQALGEFNSNLDMRRFSVVWSSVAVYGRDHRD